MKGYEESYLKSMTKPHSRFLPKLHKINPQGPSQINLLYDIQSINESLCSEEFKYERGFLFSMSEEIIRKKVVKELLGSINRKSNIIQNGFGVWKVNDSSPQRNTRLSSKLQTINQKMMESSIRKITELNHIKFNMFGRPQNKKWKVQPIYQSVTTLQRRKKLMTNINQESPKQKKMKSSPDVLTRRFNTQESKISKISVVKSKVKNKFHETNSTGATTEREITENDIRRLLLRQKNSLLSIWLPPTSHPQFYGLFVGKVVALKKDHMGKLLLKKYYISKYAFSGRLLEALLHYYSEKSSLVLQKCVISANRKEFKQIFQKLGCKIRSIQGTDVLTVQYIRKDFY